VRVRIRRFEKPGLVVKPLVGQGYTIAYGEILTAERLPRHRGLRLHTRTTGPVRVAVRSDDVIAVESELRLHGVRIVDCLGCLLTPTLSDFELELDQEPMSMRQSYDNA
jgi:hypothetical protein